MAYDKEALEYHQYPKPGKTSVVPSKPCITQWDLSLAYTPGVAVPCLKIAEDADDAYAYTNKGNLVAVVSNGTAVLGLGDIGAVAGKPVMEGKGVLFKRFAGVDVFDIELDTKDADEIIRTCELLAPTFGGINLEDIKAPECFAIEEALKDKLDIPVFHDDQHGTAIISGAALINALEIIGKKPEEIRVVFSGAGAAGIACAKFYESLGVRHDNILMTDSKGVLWEGREDLDPSHPRYNPYKGYFTRPTDCRTLADAMKDADAFAGVSLAGLLKPEMVKTMAKDPIVFAMANPDPEITYEDAMAARSDCVMATGRSDYPNQVNNVLGFPFIFRGALDVRARAINEEMKVAAAQALADLAKADVPDSVTRAYGLERLQFGREYLIPKPFDPRVLTVEAMAVAKAAVSSGVARKKIEDWDAYRDSLELLLGAERETVRRLIYQAQRQPTRIVFAEGADTKVLRAAQRIVDEGIAKPILLGPPLLIQKTAKERGVSLEGIELVAPLQSPLYDRFVEQYYQLRRRKGIARDDAHRHLMRRSYFGPMMVREGEADVFISGRTRYYPSALEPMLQVMADEIHDSGRRVIAAHIAIKDGKHFLLGDTGLHIDPTAEELVSFAESLHQLAGELDIDPTIAMLSYSNLGSVRSPSSEKVRRATEMLWDKHPSWRVDGELQADTAIDAEMLAEDFPFAKIQGGANCLVFPNLDSSNIAFRLLRSLGDVTLIGPVICGLDTPMHILQRGASPEDIVNIAVIGAVQAQARQQAKRAAATG